MDSRQSVKHVLGVQEHTGTYQQKHDLKNSSVVFLHFGRPPPPPPFVVKEPFVVKDYEKGPFFKPSLIMMVVIIIMIVMIEILRIMMKKLPKTKIVFTFE